MSTTLDSLHVEILRLPRAERAQLLDRLVDSLDGGDDATEAEWDRVADSREAELQRGEASAINLEDALHQLQARFPRSPGSPG
jgi:hypothetical protein